MHNAYNGKGIKVLLLTHFAGTVLQGSILCTIVFARLFIRILFDFVYLVEHQILNFSEFFYDSSLLKKV